MTATPPTTAATPPARPAAVPGLAFDDEGRGLAELERSLRELRIDRSASAEELYDELDSAREALRVACAQLRHHQLELARLRNDRDRGDAQLADLVRRLPVPTLATDRHGVVRELSPGAEALLGRAASGLVGRPLVLVVAEEHRAAVRSLLARGADQRLSGFARISVGSSTTSVELRAHPAGAGVVWVLMPDADPQAAVTGDLSHGIVAVSTLLAENADLRGLVSMAVHRVAALFAGAAISVVVGDPGEPEVLGTSSRRAQLVDRAQRAAEQGPTYDAWRDGATVATSSLASDERWPGLSDHLPKGDVSVVAAALSGTVPPASGVLTVVSDRPAPAVQVLAVELLAETLGAVLHEHRVRQELGSTTNQLEAALTSRAVIDQAKGVVMSQRGCTEDEAFQHLVDLSSRQHVKLREVAAGIVSGTGRADGHGG